MRVRLVGAGLGALLALLMTSFAPAGALAHHTDSEWDDKACQGPFNCPIVNPRCPPQTQGCSLGGQGENRGWRKNTESQRFDKPGENGKDAIQWPVTLPAKLRDGLGNDRFDVGESTTTVNYGQLKQIKGEPHVFAFAVRVQGGDHASGWLARSSIADKRIKRMRDRSPRDPGHGDLPTVYRVAPVSNKKYGSLKIRKNSKALRQRAADYLNRDGVVNLNYSTPGYGGSASDAAPLGATFRRARGVESVETKLYRPRSSKPHRLTMTFVYGQVDGRYGWIARDAIEEAPMARNPAGPGLPPQTSGIVGARQVAVGGNGRMMLISACGAAYSKDDPAAGWTLQTGCGNAQQVAVGGNGRMMLISGCGAAFSKDNTFDHFTEQTGCGNARQVAVGETGRMMLISGCGAAFSKDNTHDNFTEQTGCGNAQQVAVGGRGRMMLISGCGAAFSKDNTHDNFTEQTGCGNAQQVAVGGNGRMMLISGCGAAFSKDNTFDHFTEQTGCGNARQVAVGGNGRMMLISGCGAAFSKDNTFDHFTEQTGCGNARQVAVGQTGRMMLISGCGAAFSKDYPQDNWHQQTGCE